MKKIIITITIFAMATFSNATDLQSSKHNWNGNIVKTKVTAKITLASYSTNRNNSMIINIEKAATNSYKSKLAMAKDEKAKAKVAGFEWNTIRKLIRSAARYHKKGNNTAAMNKLDIAITHAKLGQQQAVDQKMAGPTF